MLYLLHYDCEIAGSTLEITKTDVQVTYGSDFLICLGQCINSVFPLDELIVNSDICDHRCI